MKIGVFGDVHGNKYALESVLKDMKSKNVDMIVCTGDLVGYMPFPKEVIHLVRQNKILVIKGNHDDRIGQLERLSEEQIKSMCASDLQKSASAQYINFLLSDDEIKYLNTLPEQATLQFADKKVLFVHGSPSSISEYMYDQADLLRGIGSQVDVDCIVSGHTHLPYHTQVEGTNYLNPGSVGKPKHGNKNSKYLIMDISDDIRSDFIEVAYEVEKMVEAIKEDANIANGIADSLLKGL